MEDNTKKEENGNNEDSLKEIKGWYWTGDKAETDHDEDHNSVCVIYNNYKNDICEDVRDPYLRSSSNYTFFIH